MAETVKVKKGDTLSAIAKANNTTVAKIAAANPQITNVNVIKPNQVITLPTAAPAKAAAAAPVFNADPATIALQRLTSGGTLTPEQRTLLGMSNPSTSTSSTSTSTSSTSTSTSSTSTSTSTSTTTDGDIVVSVYTDPETGDIFQVWKSGKKTLLKAGTKSADDAAAKAKALYDAEQAALAKAAADAAEKRDAFALVQDTMRSYGFTDAELAELSGYIESSIIYPNVGPNAAILGMRNIKV